MNVVSLTRKFEDGEGVSEYVKNISEFINDKGHSSTVVTFDDGAPYTISEDIDVSRMRMPFDGDNIFNWAMMFNKEVEGFVSTGMNSRDVDIIHANDWATVPAGITASRHLEIPLVVTIHSTENERGFEGEHASMISELEYKAVQEADAVLATNEGTKNSLLFDLDVSDEKLHVVDPYTDEWTEKILSIYHEVAPEKVKAG